MNMITNFLLIFANMNNSPRGKMRTVFILFFVFLGAWTNETAYATSETLLKAGADVNYKQLVQCIKGNNNDISHCTSQFIEYLKAEKKLLSGAADKKRYQGRLVKMIGYFKKSTDIFIDKAKQTHDLKAWKKAAACSSLLARLSSDYADEYGKIEQEYQLFKKGSSASAGLAALLRKMKQVKEPNSHYVHMLTKFTNAATKGYNVLSPSFQKEATIYAQHQVNNFIKKMDDYNNSLKNREKISLVSANSWRKTYDIVRNFPKVSAKKEDVHTRTEVFCRQLTDYVTQFDEIEKSVLSGYQLVKDKRQVKNLARLAQETGTHYEIVKNILSQTDHVNEICPNPPTLEVTRAQKIESGLSFQTNFAEGAIQEESGNLFAAALAYKSALHVPGVPDDIKKICIISGKKLNDRLFKNLQESVSEALKEKKGVNEILPLMDKVIESMRHDSEFVSKVRSFQRETLLRMGKEFRSGQRKMQSLQDAHIAFMPVYNKVYLMYPPLDGPKDKEKYYAWPCKIDHKYGSGYLCQDTSWISKGGGLEAFFLRDIKEKPTELLSGSMVSVVGRYVKNEEVQMVLGNTRQIPVLVDCYIFYRNANEYSIDKLDEILGGTK